MQNAHAASKPELDLEALARQARELHDAHPSDIAAAIDQLDTEEIRALLRHFSEETNAEIITELPHDLQTQLMEKMRISRVADILPEMRSDDAADALGDVSPERLQDIMESLPQEEGEEIADLLEYPEDSAGGIMQKEVLAVNMSQTLAETREQLRRDEDQDEDSAIYVYAVDDENRLRGILRLRDLIFRRPSLTVESVMVSDVRSVNASDDQERIAYLFQKYNYIALPVIDDQAKLVGLVTSDDVIDVIQEEATEDMQRMVGLSGEEMVSTPWIRSVQKRLPWLCVNLGTAFVIAYVVSFFEPTIADYAVLAAFLPVVALLGGNAGMQTLTIMVRSLALGEIEKSEWRRVLVKELFVGMVSGLAIGCLVGLISWLWKGSYVLGIVVALAMLLNMIAAALAGVLVPITLRTLKIDPALASSIIVTTLTDLVGFALFLGLATAAFALFAP